MYIQTLHSRDPAPPRRPSLGPRADPPHSTMQASLFQWQPLPSPSAQKEAVQSTVLLLLGVKQEEGTDQPTLCFAGPGT